MSYVVRKRHLVTFSSLSANYYINPINLCKLLKNNNMTNIKTLFQTHKTAIYTHLTAFIVGGVISFLIFTTQTETQENENELIEINAGTEILKEDFKPTEDLNDELEMLNQELEVAYKSNEKLKQQLKDEKTKKINDAQYLSDEQLQRIITEWAKRNGSLPK